MYGVAHHEPPHQDLCCLQIQLILFLVHKELNTQTQNLLLNQYFGCFQVLYTHQKQKKAKTWHDGVLKASAHCKKVRQFLIDHT